MTMDGGTGAGRTIIEEVRQIIAFVEEQTGLPSSLSGAVRRPTLTISSASTPPQAA